MVQFAPLADGIPVVSSDTQRDARYPTPALNQRVYNTATTSIERYTGSGWTVEFTGVTAQAAAITAAVLASLPAMTSLDVDNALVQRDASGNFAANVITAALAGNATSATTASALAPKAQVQVSSAGGNIFTPATQGQYYLIISGKNTANGQPSTLGFVDVVVLNGATGWVPTFVSSATTVGSPGARTYANNTGALSVATAGAVVTWYVDVVILQFGS